MRAIIVLAMFQAVSLAMAGSRFEPERKNRRVKVMNVNLFSGPYAGASADDATGRITMNNVDGSFKIDMFCVEKAEILTQNMRVRVFGSDRQLDASKGDSL